MLELTSKTILASLSHIHIQTPIMSMLNFVNYVILCHANITITQNDYQHFQVQSAIHPLGEKPKTMIRWWALPYDAGVATVTTRKQSFIPQEKVLPTVAIKSPSLDFSGG